MALFLNKKEPTCELSVTYVMDICYGQESLKKTGDFIFLSGGGSALQQGWKSTIENT